MDEERAPPRLLQTLGPAGDCVREVLSQEELAPSPPRFAQLQERRRWRMQRQRGLVFVGLAVALVSARALQHEEPLPNISAEHAVSSSSQRPEATSSMSPGELPAERDLLAPRAPKLEGPATAAPKAVAPRPSGPAPTRADDPHPLSADAAGTRAGDATTGGGAKACAQLARGGASEQALACYAKLAGGSGMTAELALFEQARLEGKALRRPERALRTLDDYRRRFPNGSLRAEVMLAQIDWLLAAGDSPRALQVVDEALASGLLRERSAELERLRSRLGVVPE